MPIRREKDPMGMVGRAWYVDSAADLSKLPKQAAVLIDPRTEAIFRDLPGALARMAAGAPLPSMTRWLESLAGVRCVLEVYAMSYGDECRLRFHFGELWAPSFCGVPRIARVDCPDIVTKVHATTGAIDVQFGCSGTLVALDQVETLKELVKGQKVLNFTELRKRIKRQPELGAYVGVFEADGDWLCADGSGRCFWAGGEWLGDDLVPAELDLTTVLDRYFDALAEQRYFRPGLAT